MDYQATIGLEVHIQIKTERKLFCGCAYTFGAVPNSITCPICLGLPGVLPVLNDAALVQGIRAALALNCEVVEETKFDRKNYFYPDLPKGYQISQYDRPFAKRGRITLADGTVIRIHRIHLEEDAGKGIHDRGNFTLLDFNRAGVPLLECVSEPDLHHAADVVEYLNILKQTMQYTGVSDCDMEKGSLRCDVNVSVAAKGSTSLGTKVEIKNLNSFRHVAKALEYEIARQEACLTHAQPIVQETRLWREAEAKTMTMRSKEEAHDYRYFPEPDLPIYCIAREFVQRLRSELPELPEARRERMQKIYDLSVQDANLLTQDRELADYFEATAKLLNSAKSAANWVCTVVLEILNEQGIGIDKLGVAPSQLADLIRQVAEGKLNIQTGRKVFFTMIKTGKDAQTVIAEQDLQQISDAQQIENLCRNAIRALPKAVEQFKAGKEKAIDSLVGKVMGATRGRANPKLVQATLRQLIAKD